MANNRKTILTTEEVARAIRVEPDYDKVELQELAEAATSFIANKTGHDWSQDTNIDPTAKECARLYVKQLHFGHDGYNKEHDYTMGIGSYIGDLKDILRKRTS